MSNNDSIKVYLASPFFITSELNTVKKLESLIRSFSQFKLYSPREHGVLGGKKFNKSSRLEIFKSNIDNLTTADLVIANIDNRDTGTNFELGYFYAYKSLRLDRTNGPKIITFSDNNFGVNVMIGETILNHFTAYDDLADYLNSLKTLEDLNNRDIRGVSENVSVY